jgi:Na+-transporting methylmalonyl-CoA/oxaloacetate decarboxylase gamma subunit
MGVALIIIAAVLIALVVVITVRGQRADRTVREREQAEARVTAGKAEAQLEESLSRRADVRAAHAERAKREGSDTDE